jgi:putative phosphoribosyl transferase
MRLFRDRVDAGKRLTKELKRYAGRDDVVVLALPRGGVVVGFEVARALSAPLDVFVVRKLGLPGREELAMGAIASGGVRVLNEEVVRWNRVSDSMIDAVALREQRELERRELLYRSGRPMPDLRNKTIVLVDDGLATGTTMRAAVIALRSFKPAHMIIAVPTGPPETCKEFEEEVETVICATTPQPFWAIGIWYEDFRQTTDEEVQRLLSAAARFTTPVISNRNEENGMGRSSKTLLKEHEVGIDAGLVTLKGHLSVPDGAQGIVLFAHGSGSSRFSPRNQFVARGLREGGLATLLLDLLTTEEEEADVDTKQYRFDIALLASRVVSATDWLLRQPLSADLRIGYFGSSTGAAAALIAAAKRPDAVGAIVSRGGRPDLAMADLAKVKAPTLLLVGDKDTLVIEFNYDALARIHAEKKLEIIPGAGHLFEEKGALQKVVHLARKWFVHHLTSAGGGFEKAV